MEDDDVGIYLFEYLNRSDNTINKKTQHSKLK
jgi:hypothetical protein